MFATFLVQAETAPKRVLILVASNANYPGLTIAAQSAMKRLNEKSPVKLELLLHYLDLARFTDERQASLAAEYLAKKYADEIIDMVITVGLPASEFMIKFRNSISPGASLVLCCLSSDVSRSAGKLSKATAIINDRDISKTLELAERLQPATHDLVVVAGSSYFDQQWVELAREQIARRDRGFKTRYLIGIPYEELLREVAKLPSDTIVVTLTYFADKNDVRHVSADVLRGILQASSAPVYAPYATNFGNGMVGGYSATDQSMGDELADVALGVLRGSELEIPSVRTSSASAYRVDDRQLRRWKLPTRNLPPETVISFQSPTLWEQHRNLMMAVIAAFAALVAVIIFLVSQNARRVRAERSMDESNKRMVFAAASTKSGLWQLESEDSQMWMTEYCRTIFDMANGELATLDALANRVHVEDKSYFVKKMRSALESDGPIDFDFRIMCRDGTIRSISAKGQASRPLHGKLPVVNGLFTDVTALKEAESEAELQRSEVAHLMRQSIINELSGSIAHELNQPLTSILSNAEAAQDLLDAHKLDRAKLREILNDIVEEDSRAAEVISRVRGLLRKGNTSREAISIGALIESTLNLLKGVFVKRKIAVSVQISGELKPIFADVVQLQQVLINLLINAMDAMATVPVVERKITIGAVCDGDRVKVTISDCGRGIPEEVSDRLLQPFVSTKEKGMGLGLSICESIVKSHSGSILIKNNIDRGVTATLEFPILKVLEAAQ
jgi:C4-dicarboxylate-specific signal transduction histidine kinase